MSCERGGVPGDGGEADLAEEERAVLNQLGVQSAVSQKLECSQIMRNWCDTHHPPVSLKGCEVADFQVVTEQVKAQDCLMQKKRGNVDGDQPTSPQSWQV